MKKLLFFLLTFSVLLAHGQLPVVQRSPASVVPLDQHLFVKSFKMPVYVDTAHALAASGIDSIGLIFKEYGTSTVWQRDTVLTGGHHWTILNGGGGGGSFDSTTLDIHSTGFNKTVFVQRKDSAANQSFGYVTQASRKKLADSLAALVGSGGYDSAASQGGGFHTDGFNVGKYVQRKDSAANEAFGYVTQASRQKLSDSLQAVDAAARAFKKNTADSSANQSFGYVTQASRQKLADSLLLVLLHRWDTAAGNPGSYVTWASRKKLIDSLTSILDTTKIRYYGTGDTMLRAGGLQLLSALVRDSGNVHITINPDSSLTFYGSGGGGTDSGFNVLRSNLATQLVPILKGTAGALRNILWDTAAGNPAAIVTQASRKKLADSLATLIVGGGGGGGAYYPPLDSVLWKGPISARNMQVAGIKSTGQDTLTATTYSEGYDRVVVQDTATGAGNGKLYRRKMQTIDMGGAAQGFQPYWDVASSTFKLASGSGNIMDARKDTIYNGTTIIPIDGNPNNTGWDNLRSQRNTQAFLAMLFDTSVSNTTQFRLMTAGNSMFEHPDLLEPNLIRYLYPLTRFAGPGFISPGNNKSAVTVVSPGSSWTTRSLISGTPGKGIDGWDAISTGGTDSIVVSFGTQNKGFSYTWADTVSVFWYGQSGGGTMKVDIDGIGGGSYVTINTASALGPQQTKIATTTRQSHTVTITSVTEGTTHNIWCGLNEYRTTGGFIFEHVAKGASVVSDWTALNASDWNTWLSFIKPSAVWMDWTVTSAGVMDSAGYASGVRTMMSRVHGYDTTIDLVLYGTTPLSATTSGATAFNRLPSYNRVIKRLAQDSNVAFWDPACIYGKTIFTGVYRGVMSTDSVHRTSIGSYAEVGMQLAGFGMLSMNTPPNPTIYTADGHIYDPRTINVHNNFFHIDSVNFFRIRGILTHGILTLDFSGTTSIGVQTGGMPIIGDFPLTTTALTVNNANNAINAVNISTPNGSNSTGIAITGGGGSTPTHYGIYSTPSSTIQNVWHNENTGAGDAIVEMKTDGAAGRPYALYINNVTTTQAWAAGLNPAHSKNYEIGQSAQWGGGIDWAITTNHGVLVNSSTDIPTSVFSVISTTKAAIPMPRMTTTNISSISSPIEGLMAYDNVLHSPYYYNGSAWTAFGGGGGGGGISGSGTVNFIPLWTSSSAQGNSDLRDSSGYVANGTFPDATGTWGFLNGFKNARFNTWNGSSSAGYISTNQTSGSLWLEFHRTSSSGTNGVKFDGGSLITENTATGEIQHFAPTGGYFHTWYSNNSEFMRSTSGGHLLLGTTSDISTSKFSIVSTTLGSVPLPSMTTTQRNAISSPAEALMVYDNVAHAPYFYNGSAWSIFGSGTVTPPVVLSGGVTANLGTGFYIQSPGSATFTAANPGVVGAQPAAFNFGGSNTITAASATTVVNPSNVIIGGPPIAGTNVTFSGNAYALDVVTGNSFFNGDATIVGHVVSNASHGSSSAGSGAGTSPSVTWTGTDQVGSISVTIGTSPSGSNATIYTFNFGAAYPTNTFVTLTPGNNATAALTGATQIYVTSSTSSFSLTSGATALTNGTTYLWYYHVGSN